MLSKSSTTTTTRTMLNLLNIDDDDTTTTTATPTSTKKLINRSTRKSSRAIIITNPNSNLEIMVGEWYYSTTTLRNIVVTYLDVHSHLNFYVIAYTITEASIASLTTTAITCANIIFANIYNNILYIQV